MIATECDVQRCMPVKRLRARGRHHVCNPPTLDRARRGTVGAFLSVPFLILELVIGDHMTIKTETDLPG